MTVRVDNFVERKLESVPVQGVSKGGHIHTASVRFCQKIAS